MLISYTKADLKERLNHPDICRDGYISGILTTAFPQTLAQQFAEPMYKHRLRSEIIATQLANDMVNYMGITFVNRLSDSTGASVSDIARAYLTARDIFSLPECWQQIAELDYQIDATLQEDMMADLMRLVRRGSRWFLRNRRASVDIAAEVDKFREAVKNIMTSLGEILKGDELESWQQLYEQRVAAGVPKDLASITAGAANLYSALGIIEVAEQSCTDVNLVAETYFEMGDQLSLSWFMQQINALPSPSHWEGLARETLRDDLDWQQRALAEGVLGLLQQEGELGAAITAWEQEQAPLLGRWNRMLTELKNVDSVEFPMVSVALRELLDLAQASRHHKVCDEL